MRNGLAGLTLIGTVAGTAACASSPVARSGDDCVLAAADSALAGSMPLYLACSVDAPAEVITDRVEFRQPPPGRSMARPGVTCYVAEVQFVVAADGRPEPETIRLVRGVPDEFTSAVLASVPGWSYSPAMADGRPVRQLVRERRTAALIVTVSAPGQNRPRRPPAPANCR